MVEGQTRQNMPEPPINNSIEDILKEREVIAIRQFLESRNYFKKLKRTIRLLLFLLVCLQYCY